MNIEQNKFWLGLSTVVMGALFVIFVLLLNLVFLCLLLASALINFFLGVRLYHAMHPGKL
jgi:hypothetical protein